MAAGTRDRLARAAADVLRTDGIAGLSARTIATRAGVNQALIFYHFDTVSGLVDVACRQAVDENVEHYRAQFASVTTMVQLLEVGRQLHTQEQDSGNVMMMAQLMAGAQQDEVLAAAARYAMSVWTAEIELVVRRVLAGSPLLEIADPAGLAKAISSGFLGFELYDGVDPDGATAALGAIERLGVLVEVLEDLGPVARRALRAKVRRRT